MLTMSIPSGKVIPKYVLHSSNTVASICCLLPHMLAAHTGCARLIVPRLIWLYSVVWCTDCMSYDEVSHYSELPLQSECKACFPLPLLLAWECHYIECLFNNRTLNIFHAAQDSLKQWRHNQNAVVRCAARDFGWRCKQLSSTLAVLNLLQQCCRTPRHCWRVFEAFMPSNLWRALPSTVWARLVWQHRGHVWAQQSR